METRERQAVEVVMLSKISQLSEENKTELLDFIKWITANKATPDEITAEMERRQANR